MDQLKIKLEKEMATHSSIPAWKISWTEEPGSSCLFLLTAPIIIHLTLEQHGSYVCQHSTQLKIRE